MRSSSLHTSLRAAAKNSGKASRQRGRKTLPARIHEVSTLLERHYGTVVWRSRLDPTGELVLTILSQHTSDLNSDRAFQELCRRFPSWDLVLKAPTDGIAEAIRGGGLANQKAPRIQNVLREIIDRRGDLDISFLVEWPLAEAKAWLKSLPGVGPKTAAVVLCFALGMPAFPVDTHVHRVAKRLFLIDQRVSADEAHSVLEPLIDANLVFAFHTHLITHGRRTCKARRPHCSECVLSTNCPSFGTIPGAV